MTINNLSKEAAEILIDIGAVEIQPDNPFILTSGRRSPVYVDCRRIISFPKERKRLMEMAVHKINFIHNKKKFTLVAGGETAGIPFAAWLSELMNVPMIYIRKKPKGFGKNKKIEGIIKPRDNVLLIEDLATDGGSKMTFINSIREVDADCFFCFVIFHYGIFKESIKTLKSKNVTLFELATWKDILKVSEDRGMTSTHLKKIKAFLNDPDEWNQNI